MRNVLRMHGAGDERGVVATQSAHKTSGVVPGERWNYKVLDSFHHKIDPRSKTPSQRLHYRLLTVPRAFHIAIVQRINIEDARRAPPPTSTYRLYKAVCAASLRQSKQSTSSSYSASRPAFFYPTCRDEILFEFPLVFAFVLCPESSGCWFYVYVLFPLFHVSFLIKYLFRHRRILQTYFHSQE